ncbi:MAG: hypothetical protein ACI4V1_02340 [Eubacteriales bacterium]
MKKRALALLLACMMLLLNLAACSENAVETERTANETVPSSEPSVDTETEPEEETELQPNIPSLDFGGRTFTFLTSGINDTNGVDWETYDIWVETLNGDVINDAVFDRNLYLEDAYNVKIAEYKTNTTTLGEIQTEVKAASGAFDAAMTHIENGANLAQSGSLLDLYDIDYIDTDQPWWDGRAVEDLEVLNSLYFATGDITVIDNDATWVLMFNKQMHEDLQMENLYDMVREDRWTFDVFYDLAAQGSMDMNGDGTLKWKDDQFGFLTSGDSAYGLMYASGEKLVLRDPENVFVGLSDIERLSGVVEKAAKIMGDKSITFQTGYEGSGSSDLRIIFEEGRGLFFGEVMQCIIRMRESETQFGLIPWPKYDEGQSEYYNWIHTSAGRGVVIPASQTDYEFVGAIVEATAAKSMYTVTPAYYDVALTYKYMRDTESAEMLDIILDSRIYDLGRIYNFGALSTNIATIINNGSGGLASTWAKMERAFEKIMTKTADKFAELEDRG